MESNESVCLFPPAKQKSDNIRIINFVSEKHAEKFEGFTVKSSYIMYLVSGGRGVLHTISGDYELSKGTLFYTFPAKPHRIESVDALEYIYISFFGLSAIPILERLGIDNSRPVFAGFTVLLNFWNEALEISTDENTDLTAMSVLFYTFSKISQRCLKESNVKEYDVLPKIIDYIDSRYYESTLNLEKLCGEFSYNPKYMSRLFKKSMGIGYTEYLRSVRVRHACSLMSEGITDIKDLAYLVGFSDPLYFSRVFKKLMGVSPTQHLAEIKKAREKRI